MKENESAAGQEPRSTDPENHNDQSFEPAVETEPEALRPEEPNTPIIEGEASSSQVDALIQIAEEGCDLFHDRVDTPYARIGMETVLRIEGSGFGDYPSPSGGGEGR